MWSSCNEDGIGYIVVKDITLQRDTQVIAKVMVLIKCLKFTRTLARCIACSSEASGI